MSFLFGTIEPRAQCAAVSTSRGDIFKVFVFIDPMHSSG